jgi:hypothetical protein
MLRVKHKTLHPHRTAVIIIGSSTAGLRPEEKEMDKDKDIITAPAAGGGSY